MQKYRYIYRKNMVDHQTTKSRNCLNATGECWNPQANTYFLQFGLLYVGSGGGFWTREVGFGIHREFGNQQVSFGIGRWVLESGGGCWNPQVILELGGALKSGGERSNDDGANGLNTALASSNSLVFFMWDRGMGFGIGR